MTRRNYTAPLTLFAIIVLATLFIAGQGNSRAYLGGTSRAASYSPDTVWTLPVKVSTLAGYDNAPFIAASPPNGAAEVFWAYANGNDAGIATNSNQSLGGPFGQQHNIENYAPDLID